MKFPSLMRTPKHQRFRIEPRYYDPVKEDIKNRTERIRKELELTKEGKDFSSSLRGSFQRGSRTSPNTVSSIRQLILIVTFLVLAFGYIEIGNQIFHFLWIFVPIYIFYRLKRVKKSKANG
jgi:hypothetical protein